MRRGLSRLNYHKKFLSTLGVNYVDDEVSMPKGYFKRKKELAIWLKSDQDREVEKTEYSKRKKAEKNKNPLLVQGIFVA